ncbi:MAG TPA: hypothetical protein VGK14_12210 [Novimethylophilus sp.]|jgi:glutamine synthetase|uniref:hypothetical protein n=1 Tax=Novimethylophilus sp. TaxID=2137426 RepID=UPI002F422ACA
MKTNEEIATMMPKPFADKTGSNLFACDPAADPRGFGLTQPGYQFIAGILRHGPALCVAFAPSVDNLHAIKA